MGSTVMSKRASGVAKARSLLVKIDGKMAALERQAREQPSAEVACQMALLLFERAKIDSIIRDVRE